MSKATKYLFIATLICLSCSTASATIVGITEESGINFIPFDELFAPEYQPRYIIDSRIAVGPYSYGVFIDYTMMERQVIFQVCKKHLPWEYTLEQGQWERTMYMYQFVVKPYPFPFPEYQPIPEPSTIIMLSVGCLSFLTRR